MYSEIGVCSQSKLRKINVIKKIIVLSFISLFDLFAQVKSAKQKHTSYVFDIYIASDICDMFTMTHTLYAKQI